MHHVTIAADLPDPMGQRESIAEVVKAALVGRQGRWTVHVRPAHIPNWWTVELARTEDGFRRTLVLDPTKQTPHYVSRALKGVLEEIS